MWLDSEKRQGRVKGWRYEVAIPLHTGNRKLIGAYIVDFVVRFLDGHEEFHEVKSKGTITDLWRWKWKHSKLEYPNRVFKMIWG